MRQLLLSIGLFFLLFASACSSAPPNSGTVPDSAETPPATGTSSNRASVLPSLLLSQNEVSSIADEWVFPGIDRTLELQETYCGADCTAMDWYGIPERIADRLYIGIIHHEDVPNAEEFMEVFRNEMLSEQFALFYEPFDSVTAEDFMGAADFTQFHTIIREGDITIHVSVTFRWSASRDEARGATFITEKYAQLQLDKLIQAGYTSEFFTAIPAVGVGKA